MKELAQKVGAWLGLSYLIPLLIIIATSLLEKNPLEMFGNLEIANIVLATNLCFLICVIDLLDKKNPYYNTIFALVIIGGFWLGINVADIKMFQSHLSLEFYAVINALTLIGAIWGAILVKSGEKGIREESEILTSLFILIGDTLNSLFPDTYINIYLLRVKYNGDKIMLKRDDNIQNVKRRPRGSGTLGIFYPDSPHRVLAICQAYLNDKPVLQDLVKEPKEYPKDLNRHMDDYKWVLAAPIRYKVGNKAVVSGIICFNSIVAPVSDSDKRCLIDIIECLCSTVEHDYCVDSKLKRIFF